MNFNNCRVVIYKYRTCERQRNNMNEIVNFVKEIFMFDTNEKMLVGLCGFEHMKDKTSTTKTKPKRKREMRLSELME